MVAVARRGLPKYAIVAAMGLAIGTSASRSEAICIREDLEFDDDLKTCFQDGENGTARGTVQNGVRAIFVSLQQDVSDEDLAQVGGVDADGFGIPECRAFTLTAAPAVAGDPDRLTNLQGDREGLSLSGELVQFDGSCARAETYVLVVLNGEVPQ
jgi:hypothetical protein